MATTVGVWTWRRQRTTPTTGRVALASDPIPGYTNTLRVHITDKYGNNRSALLAAIASGDQIRLVEDDGLVAANIVTGTPTLASSVYSIPFTVSQLFDPDTEPSENATIFIFEDAGVSWPTAAELAQTLNLGPDGTTDWATTLARVMDSAIARVKSDVGDWSAQSDVPTSNQAQAALRMGFLMWTSPESPSLGLDPSYRSLLSGQRRRFAIA